MRRAVMYVVIRDYQSQGSDVAAQAVQRQESLKQVLRAISGFSAYYVVDKGIGALTTISIYQDKVGAEQSIHEAANWVRENMAQWAPTPPAVIQGEVIIEASR